MSLLDRGPHTVTLRLAVPVKGAYNETIRTYPDPLITVGGCSVQPLRAEEVTSLGLQVDTAYRVICRYWPGGPDSKVEWDGRTWFQYGETLHATTGRRTRHDKAVIVAQSAEVK